MFKFSALTFVEAFLVTFWGQKVTLRSIGG